MSVVIDTPVWSLALRRRPSALNSHDTQLVREWGDLVHSGDALLIGPIRQELLSGLPNQKLFDALADRLADFVDLSIIQADYVRAAAYFNACRAHGVTGSAIDLLICAVADRHRVPIFTTDLDFQRYARHLPIRLYQPPTGRSPTTPALP